MAVLSSDPGAASGVSCELEQSNSGGTMKFLGDTLVQGADFKTGDGWLHRNFWKWGAMRDTLGKMRCEDQRDFS